MKKRPFLFVIMAAAAVVTVSTVNANSSKLSDLLTKNIEALAECEDSVRKDGMLVTVTVCNRTTDKDGDRLGIWCNAPAEMPCQFTNIH